MYSVMTKLISKRYYATGAVAQEKLDVFYAVGRLTDDQYTGLTLLVAERYPAED